MDTYRNYAKLTHNDTPVEYYIDHKKKSNKSCLPKKKIRIDPKLLII